jgi:hypothetical protein
MTAIRMMGAAMPAQFDRDRHVQGFKTFHLHHPPKGQGVVVEVFSGTGMPGKTTTALSASRRRRIFTSSPASTLPSGIAWGRIMKRRGIEPPPGTII